MIVHFCKMILIIISLIISVSSEPTETSGVDCDPRGTKYTSENGECECKGRVTGEKCNQCELGSFFLSSENRLGCIPCFCAGVTKNCTSSSLNRDKIHIADKDLLAGISLTTPFDLTMPIIRSGFHLDSNDGISYNQFPNRETREKYYWVLPKAFSGNLLTSYGGNLTYTSQCVSSSNLGHNPFAAQVILRSSDHKEITYYSKGSLQLSLSQTFTVVLLEDNWGSTRDQFLQILANIVSIEIKASYSKYADSVSISNVSLDIATNSGNGMKKASEVEECSCPFEYIGLSCEKCITGYTRSDRRPFSSRTCIPCNCNNNSNQCDPETGVCENCVRHTAGKYCELCEDGYEGDPTNEGCLSQESQSVIKLPPKCHCNVAGAINYECTYGACQCKHNVEGDKCDSCRSSTFGLSEDNVDGCNECFCSGLSNECHESSLYIQKIIPNFDNVNELLTLVNAETKSSVDHEELDIKESTEEIEYWYEASTPSFPAMWSLPAIFTGNKVTSYGGHLEFSQKITSTGVSMTPSHIKVILKGNGITLSRGIYTKFNIDEFMSYSIPLRESQWKISSGSSEGVASTRADLMRALSDLEEILIFAPYAKNIESISISNVTLDTAVDDIPGGSIATQVEVCKCPLGYNGTSCESCSAGYYHDITDQSISVSYACKICPCNDNEESCEMDQNFQIHCHCAAHYTGEFCETTLLSSPEQRELQIPLRVQVDPLSQEVPEGTEIHMNCLVNDVGPNVEVKWIKWGETSLGPRAQQNGRILKIINVQVSDDGRYVCRADNGNTSSEAFAILNVVPQYVQGPILVVSPQDIQSVILGGSTALHCQDITVANQTSEVYWARRDGRSFPSNVKQLTDGVLSITEITIDDDGVYQCSAANKAGSASVLARITVISIPVIKITPSIGKTMNVKLGENVKLTCTVVGRSMANVTWRKYVRGAEEFPLSQSSTPSSAVYEILSMSEHDEGYYVCAAKNLAGVTEESIQVLIERVPAALISTTPKPPSQPENTHTEIKIYPNYLKLPIGRRVEMRCRVVGRSNRKIHLQWRRSNGSPIPRHRIAHGLLTIPRVTKMDAGRYTCLGLDSDGTELNRTTSYLEVISLPTVILTPSNETVNLGATPSIHCIATGDGTITTKWTAIGRELLPPNVEDDNGVLKFHGIANGHVGKYLCNAKNEAGSVLQVAQVLFEPQECN